MDALKKDLEELGLSSETVGNLMASINVSDITYSYVHMELYMRVFMLLMCMGACVGLQCVDIHLKICWL